MALTTPQLYFINSFDATNDNTFEFYVSSGSQVVANRLLIRNNLDNSIVYDQTIQIFKFKHTLPANTLTNGNEYNAQVFTRDISGNESNGSNIILFTCLTTPVVNITNINNGIINNSSFEFVGSYSQAEGEEVEEYTFILYDKNETMISASPRKYDGLLKHQFSGLRDNSIHYIEMKVLTENKMEVSTGLIEFSVTYIKPMSPLVLKLENIAKEGNIKINGKIKNILATSNATNPYYIDNEMIDLRDGIYVDFEDGLNLKGDFTLKMWAKDLNEYGNFAILEGNNDSINKPMRIEMYYLNNRIEIHKKYSDQTYFVCSEKIASISSDDLIFIWLQQRDDLLNIKVQKII